MELTFFHKNLNKSEEKFFAEYVNEKRKAIEALLTKFAYDARLLKVSIEKFEKHDAYEVEFCLMLPGKSLVAKENGHEINKCVDLTKDKLLAQIKKHIASLRDRGSRTHKSIKDHKVKTPMEIFEEVAG
jgi:ribosome-associated translation inhibitor RaiA